MTIKRSRLKDYNLEELKVAPIQDEWLLKDLDRYELYGFKYIGAASLAWAYQKGRLRDNQFEILFYSKCKTKHLTNNEWRWRNSLVTHDVWHQLRKWKRGEEVLPKGPAKPRQRRLTAAEEKELDKQHRQKIKDARVRLKKELREKRLRCQST